MSLVGAYAASHAPGITGRPTLPPPADSEPVFRAYAELRARIEAARADVLVVVSPEHWANFFLDHMPSFCIGIADEFWGPTDEEFVKIPRRRVPGAARLARALAAGLAEDVDLSSSEELAFDHGVMVPLHLLGTTLPVIPIIVNCLAGLPAPLHRCHALGTALRRTVDGWPERVAILATGGLSHWPAMPESGTDRSRLRPPLPRCVPRRPHRDVPALSARGARGGGRAGRARDPHLDHRRRRGGRRARIAPRLPAGSGLVHRLRRRGAGPAVGAAPRPVVRRPEVRNQPVLPADLAGLAPGA